MTRAWDVCCRLLLAGLLVALFVLVNLTWLRVEMNLAVRGQEELLDEVVYAQTGLALARGEVPRVTGPRLALLLAVTPELLQGLWGKQIPGCWFLSLYGPVLLVGLMLCLVMSPGRWRGGVLFAVVVLALGLLIGQLLVGFPLTAQIEDFNRSVSENVNLNDPEGLFLKPPTMVVVPTSASTISVGMLLVAAVVAGLGWVWPAREKPPV